MLFGFRYANPATRLRFCGIGISRPISFAVSNQSDIAILTSSRAFSSVLPNAGATPGSSGTIAIYPSSSHCRRSQLHTLALILLNVIFFNDFYKLSNLIRFCPSIFILNV